MGKEGRRVTCKRMRGCSFFRGLFGLIFEAEGRIGVLYDRRVVERGVVCREGVEGSFGRWRLSEDEGEFMCGGVMSVCIARTEEGFRNGERFFSGMKGEEDWWFCCDGEGDDKRSSEEPCDVRGELCWEGISKTASSGPLEW